jgi:hypothetical protein
MSQRALSSNYLQWIFVLDVKSVLVYLDRPFNIIYKAVQLYKTIAELELTFLFGGPRKSEERTKGILGKAPPLLSISTTSLPKVETCNTNLQTEVKGAIQPEASSTSKSTKQNPERRARK